MDYNGTGSIVLRMLGIFLMALVVVRMMGNRTVGQFSPFDFVLMVGIGDIVGNMALDRRESLLTGAEALVGLLILQQFLSWASLKSKVMRKWFEGTPVVMVEDGRILYENLRSSHFNLDDLRQELHKQGLDMSDLRDIQTARLESSGDFSVIKSPETEALTLRDFNAFIQSLADNPLSPAGAATAKLEQLSEDIRLVAEYVRQQQAAVGPEPGPQPESAQDLH
ncbi:MAG: DUF421 domain-containing protein [Negativicutes bacterium]|nr:DUF421 domain-containing protein [Negativicutes bacterium]